jgi:glycerophosphoryl diester phosphodiesterase
VEIIGHRGQAEAEGPPENTLGAVETALAGGADGVEIDVRLTADGVPVCVHDPDLTRLAGRRLTVDRTAYARLRAVPLHEDHRIPALEDALALARGRGRIVLDVKHDAGDPLPLLDAALAAVRRTRTAGQVVLSSFSVAALRASAARAPAQPRALITHAGVALGPALAAAVRLGCGGLHPHLHTVLAGAGVEPVRRGMQIRSWTVNRLVDAVRLDDLGLDAVITDRPVRLRAASRAPAATG